MNVLYLVISVGALVWLAIVFQTLLGLRIVKLKGVTHRLTHRYLAFALIAIGMLHGLAALGLLVFGWF